jgi:hypothetical protein
MVINIDLGIEIELIIMVVTLCITSIFFFVRKNKLDNDYIILIIFSLLSGATVYAGLLWILKPLGIVIDNTIFDSPVYNIMMGLVLIVFTIISLRKLIKKAPSGQFSA